LSLAPLAKWDYFPAPAPMPFANLLRTLAAAGALTAAAVAGPLLINVQQASFATRPEFVRDHFLHIETLPFDGMALSTTTGAVLMKGAPRSYAEISADFAPLHGLAFTRMTHNFALVFVDRPADFFGDWSTTIENFRVLARVLREKGIKGIFFDNEEYAGTLFNHPDDCADLSKSLDQYRDQARLRGRQIMQAIAAEYPDIVFVVMHGPYSSFSGTPHSVHRGQTNWQVDELRGPFSAGLIEGMNSRAQFVDGGEVYAYRSVADFQGSYDFRKTEIASATANCPYLPDFLRPVWGQKVRISFGLYNLAFGGETMNATIMRTTLERALLRCDDFVWLYSEGQNWNAPGEVPQTWMQALVGARAAAQVPPAGAAPWVGITSPGVRSHFNSPATISLAASASDADGTVSKVEFFSGAVKLGEDLTSPYTHEWVNPAPGTHLLTAKVTDNSGATMTSSVVGITVNASFAASINFQPAGRTVPVGYFADTGSTYGSRGNGLTYGWNFSHTGAMRDREEPIERRLSTLCQFGSGGVWEMAVPNGSYRVTVGIGDSYDSTHTINVEGVGFWNAHSLAAGQYVRQTQTVTVADGRLSIDQGSAGFEATRIGYVLIAAAGAAPATPSGLTGEAASPESVALRWADNSSTETGFTLERSTSVHFGASLQIFNLPSEQTTHLDTGLNPATKYFYRVRAAGSAASSNSNVVAVTTPFLDSDGDGIPDSEETSPFTAGVDDRTADSDGDGFPNSAERLAGTDPASGSSFLQFSQITATPGVPVGTATTLLFPTVAGRMYCVDFTDSLLGGIWTALPGSTRVGDGTAQSVTDTTLSLSRCYRLQVWR
jgi:hypothetical protein